MNKFLGYSVVIGVLIYFVHYIYWDSKFNESKKKEVSGVITEVRASGQNGIVIFYEFEVNHKKYSNYESRGGFLWSFKYSEGDCISVVYSISTPNLNKIKTLGCKK